MIMQKTDVIILSKILEKREGKPATTRSTWT